MNDQQAQRAASTRNRGWHMKRILALWVILAGLGLAQERLFVGGATTGQLSFGSGVGLSLAATAGVQHLAGAFGIRGEAGLDLVGNSTQFQLGVDALFSFGNPRRDDLEPYAGAGLRLLVQSAGGASASAFGLSGVLGLMFPLNSRAALFAEFVPILLLGGSSAFVGNLQVGFLIYP